MQSRYKKLRRLGEGGFGEVYEALDTVLQRRVAVKRLHGIREDLHERFLSEARITSQLNHRNILALYDFGFDEEGSPFLVTERLYGRPLDDLLRERSMSAEEVIFLLKEICAALEVAHR
ncbi:MAG: protein kinase, partial [Myxococcota bacterium]|nr:protein kinase [Myxococcota bacterium]